MRDDHFQLFIDAMGEATHCETVSEKILKKYSPILPDKIISYWKDEGFCCYRNGLFWTVNPEKYDYLIDSWVKGTILEKKDKYHIFARSAFGHLFGWGQNSNCILTVACPLNSIIESKNNLSNNNAELKVQSFFATSEPFDFDLIDIYGNPLFERAFEQLGILSDNDLYGFEPALVAGGTIKLENLKKLNLFVHLSILREFTLPNIVIPNSANY